MPRAVFLSASSQEDETGQKISEVTVRFYGYDRDTANMGTNSVIDAVQTLVQEWDKMRKGGGNPQGPRAVKLPTVGNPWCAYGRKCEGLDWQFCLMHGSCLHESQHSEREIEWLN